MLFIPLYKNKNLTISSLLMLPTLNHRLFFFFRLIVNKKENKLKKGSGFHLDLLIIGGLAWFNSILGLPWVWAATVRSVTHTGALTVFSKTHAPGEKPKLVRIHEQRVTAFMVNLLIGKYTSKFHSQLRRSHITQYCCGYCKLRYLYYSGATVTGATTHAVAAAYPHSTFNRYSDLQ